MIQEIRLYYECLEQGKDYLLPMIEEVIPKSIPIKLVKRPKKANQFKQGALSSIMSFTTPDALITGVKNGIEIPLAIIEFTEAVKTEDHELQRTYGALAAYLSETFYIKISGHKQSEKEFGGAEYNPYSTSKILLEQFNYEGYIIAEWGTQLNNDFTLERNSKFPSCPPDIPILKDTIQSSVQAFLSSDNWFQNAVGNLKETCSYKLFREEIDRASGWKELLKTWKNRRATNLNKLRYFVNDEWIGAKINRFSHAMDPDRGILNFISFAFSKTHKIYGIYALVRPRSNDIMKKNLDSLFNLQEKLKEAIEKDRGGVPSWFSDELIEISKRATKVDDVIDIQYLWEMHKEKISDNKVISTIAFLLDGMFLNHNGIKLVWDRKKLLGNSDGDILDLLKTYFCSMKFTSPSIIVEENDEVDEDEVTYAIIHKVLIPNKFKIVSVSYPGSQGSGAILPNPELGKAQPREYPDVIALFPKSDNYYNVMLNESKGMFKKSEIENDTLKIMRYKKEDNLQKALKESLLVAQVIDEKECMRNIVVGISFGIKSNFSTLWKPDEVDFIFRIVDRKRWAIGIFNQDLRDLIPIIEGDTNFPKVYKLKK